MSASLEEAFMELTDKRIEYQGPCKARKKQQIDERNSARQ
jgi:hypothetical protein